MRSTVPRGAALVVAIAILPWIAASQVGARRVPPTSSEPPTSVSIRPITTLLVVTPDRPKVWPDSKRTAESLSLFAMPPPRAGVDASGSYAGVRRPASAGSVNVLTIHLAERGPPLLAT